MAEPNEEFQESAQGAERAEPGQNGSAEVDPASAKHDTAEAYKALNDKYVRLFAEFENFRRRTSRENFELIASANNKLIAKLTEVLDNFNLAFDPKHKAASVEDLEKGFRLIYSKFKQILEDEGLEEIDPKGAEFDPNQHEALMQQPSDSVPEHHVSEVLLKGYKVKAKILKHAKVIVSTGKAQ